MKKQTIVVILGAAASTKTTSEFTVLKRLNAQSLIPMTTRKKREDEVEGVHYYFREKEEILSSKTLNTIELKDGNIYSIPASELKKESPILVYSVISLDPVVMLMDTVKKEHPGVEFLTVFLDITREVRLNNLIANGYSRTDAITRLDRQRKVETMNDFIREGIEVNLHITELTERTQEDIVDFLKKRTEVQ